MVTRPSNYERQATSSYKVATSTPTTSPFGTFSGFWKWNETWAGAGGGHFPPFRGQEGETPWKEGEPVGRGFFSRFIAAQGDTSGGEFVL